LKDLELTSPWPACSVIFNIFAVFLGFYLFSIFDWSK